MKGIREQDIKIGRRRQDRWRKIVKMTPKSEKHTHRETGRVSLITRQEGLPRWHISLIKRSCLGESFNRAVVIQPNRRGSVLIFISLTASLIYSDVRRGRVERDRTANCLLFKSALESVTVCVHECMQKVCVRVWVCVPFPEVDCLQLVGHLVLCDSSNPIKTQERLTGSGCQGNLCQTAQSERKPAHCV